MHLGYCALSPPESPPDHGLLTDYPWVLPVILQNALVVMLRSGPLAVETGHLLCLPASQAAQGLLSLSLNDLMGESKECLLTNELGTLGVTPASALVSISLFSGPHLYSHDGQ